MGTEDRDCEYKVSKNEKIFDLLVFKTENIIKYKINDDWLDCNSIADNIDDSDVHRNINKTAKYNENELCKEYKTKDNKYKSELKTTYNKKNNANMFDTHIVETECKNKHNKKNNIEKNACIDHNAHIEKNADLEKEDIKKTSKDFYNIESGFYDNFKR
ncbi:hypothetical protein BDAP_000734 [Binucleata daphniae]